MAIKTFTSGEVLTASDTNTYLNNGGLVYVAGATASGTAGALNITNCFSATYDNYRIEMSQIKSSLLANISFQMLSGTTPATTAVYGCGFVGLSTLGASTNFSNSAQSSGFLMQSFFSTDGTGTAVFDIANPFLASRTVFLGQTANLNSGFTGFDSRSGFAIHETQTSYNGIRIIASAGNISFTARIYGYRQA